MTRLCRYQRVKLMNPQLSIIGKLAAKDIPADHNEPSACPEQNSAHRFFLE